MNYKVTQWGKELDKSRYTFDETTKCFSSEEDNLVLDFNTSSNCTFKTGEKCVVIRRDIYEIIELEEWKEIKLNWCMKKGFTYIEEKKRSITLELTDKQIEEIKNIIW